MTASGAGLLLGLTVVALQPSAVDGCRSPSMTPSVHRTGPDAQAVPISLGSARGDSQADPAAVIDYRGEEIRLTKRYDDFDVYKNDPNNIAPDEYARVKELVEAAPVPEHCADVREIVHAESDLAFPGYGSGGIGDSHATDKLRVVGASIEVPHANANRYIVYLREDRGYRLVDDAVLPEPPYIAEVTVADGKVTYRTREGAVVVERPIRSQAGR